MYGPMKHSISAVSVGGPVSAGLTLAITGGMARILWMLIVGLTVLTVGTTVYTLMPQEEK
jgi:hypothetical protein